MRELNLTFINWDINDLVVELARYIDKGFRIGGYRDEHKFAECEVHVTLYEPYHS